MERQTVVVYGSDHEWTRNALHLACALSHTRGLEIALVDMIRVQHLQWLGTELGCQNHVEQIYDQVRSYEQTVQEYNIPLTIYFHRYHSSLPDAIIESARQLNAAVVFATLPDSTLAIWRKFQLQRLEYQLLKQRCQLFTLEKPANTPDWTPSITAPVFRK